VNDVGPLKKDAGPSRALLDTTVQLDRVKFAARKEQLAELLSSRPRSFKSVSLYITNYD
jgi:hypothetical protein